MTRQNAKTFSDMSCALPFASSKDRNFTVNEFLQLEEPQGKVNGTQRATCLGCTESRRSRTGTHSGPWCDGRARCCGRTADTTGCSGARRSPGSRLWPAERGRRKGKGISLTMLDKTLYKRYIIMKQSMTRVIKGVQHKKSMAQKN